MATYDYKAGKQRIQHILNLESPVHEVLDIPRGVDATVDNGYYGWVTSIFVDIKNSSTLFQGSAKSTVAKIIRSFTSEVIEILSSNDQEDLLREVGIRGNCVFAVYSTSSKMHIQDILERAIFVNTYIKMLNKLFVSNKIPYILTAGIGMASFQELVVKAGKTGSEIHDSVWVGKSVQTAMNLSKAGARNDFHPIAISGVTHSNISDQQKALFVYSYNRVTGHIYNSDATYPTMSNWIKAGMPE